MPLSVNSPSRSNSGSLDSTMTDTLSNTTDMSSIRLTAKHYDDAYIPQFHGDSPVMAPLPETETSECEKLREIKIKDRRGGGRGRKDTHDTNSTDIFASTTANTAITGITSVSATTTRVRNSNDDGSNGTSSYSTTHSNSSSSTSSKTDRESKMNSNSKCDHPHHHS